MDQKDTETICYKFKEKLFDKNEMVKPLRTLEFY